MTLDKLQILLQIRNSFPTAHYVNKYLNRAENIQKTILITQKNLERFGYFGVTNALWEDKVNKLPNILYGTALLSCRRGAFTSCLCLF